MLQNICYKVVLIIWRNFKEKLIKKNCYLQNTRYKIVVIITKINFAKEEN